MQLSEADRLSFAFLTEIKQISRKSHLLCDFFVSFFSKKNESENLYKLRISDNNILYKCMHYAVQLRNEGKAGALGRGEGLVKKVFSQSRDDGSEVTLHTLSKFISF